MKIYIALAFLSISAISIALSARTDTKLQPAAQVPEELSDLDNDDYWNLMMIASLIIGSDKTEKDEAVDEISRIIQEQSNQMNKMPKVIKTRAEFDKVYSQAIAKPCQKIKSSYEHHKKMFDTVVGEDKDEDKIANDKQLVQVCDDVLSKEANKAEYFNRIKQNKSWDL